MHCDCDCGEKTDGHRREEHLANMCRAATGWEAIGRSLAIEPGWISKAHSPWVRGSEWNWDWDWEGDIMTTLAAACFFDLPIQLTAQQGCATQPIRGINGCSFRTVIVCGPWQSVREDSPLLFLPYTLNSPILIPIPISSFLSNENVLDPIRYDTHPIQSLNYLSPFNRPERHHVWTFSSSLWQWCTH